MSGEILEMQVIGSVRGKREEEGGGQDGREQERKKGGRGTSGQRRSCHSI